eukprot:NODE_6652_length_829_cov_85.525496_g6416_i0.p1 GENE.NODE_6652_length_829_cov_85.525496_g6416_i0~~NODE_6652_length_829_cov_85.525496_g6416_i0.p1  ORF type:complete len:187 (+),score=18.19 NODE_6652_length_829_cov_85.525496_g6416_i0:113-673(+)
MWAADVALGAIVYPLDVVYTTLALDTKEQIPVESDQIPARTQESTGSTADDQPRYRLGGALEAFNSVNLYCGYSIQLMKSVCHLVSRHMVPVYVTSNASFMPFLMAVLGVAAELTGSALDTVRARLILRSLKRKPLVKDSAYLRSMWNSEGARSFFRGFHCVGVAFIVDQFVSGFGEGLMNALRGG